MSGGLRLALLETLGLLRGAAGLSSALLCLALCGVSWLPADLPLEGAAALERAAARQGFWSILAPWIWLGVSFRAAGLVADWRRSRWADALGSSPRSAWRVLGTSWLGLVAGGALLSFGAALAAEARPAGHGHRLVGAVPVDPWIEADAAGIAERPLAMPSGVVADGLLLTLAPTPGSGASAALEVLLFDEGGRALDAAEGVLHGRTTFDLRLGAGSAAPRSLRIEGLPPGATVLVPAEGAELWREAGSERLASASLFTRSLILGALLCAWALALGAWMARGTALATAWALALAAAKLPGFPGSDWWQALDATGRGLVPAGIDPLSVVALALGAALGALVLGRGLADWSARP